MADIFMNKKEKFYIVSESILPEAILKTVKINELLVRNRNMTVNEAVDEVGLSRSAFYKYRDKVFPFYEASRSKLITLRVSMDNKPGMLSHIIDTIARANGNILTLTQGLPIQNVCIAEIAFETADLGEDLETVINQLEEIESVLQVEIVGQN